MASVPPRFAVQVTSVQRLFDSAEAAMNNGDLLGAITRLETLQGYPASAVRSASVG